MMYLMSDNESDANNALNQINFNCGFPNDDAATWSRVLKAYEQNIWFLDNVPPEGYRGQTEIFTYAQMMMGVTNVTESDGDSSWFSPPEP